jgi:hypothetical protein
MALAASWGQGQLMLMPFGALLAGALVLVVVVVVVVAIACCDLAWPGLATT